MFLAFPFLFPTLRNYFPILFLKFIKRGIQPNFTGIEHDLRAIMAEKFSNMTQTATAYFAVAVVKKSATFTINDLKVCKLMQIMQCHDNMK